MNKFMGGLTLGIIATSCFFIFYNPFEKSNIVIAAQPEALPVDSFPLPAVISRNDSVLPEYPTLVKGNEKIHRDSLVLFARTLLGTPYLYGSADPARGFDCSGFITYVFNHFNLAVPRSSYGFEHMGIRKTLATCQPGDLVLFSGTDPQERAIGHIGIVCEVSNGNPSFIHSTSGKSYGVTVTSMDNKFYQDRFIAVIDLLHAN